MKPRSRLTELEWLGLPTLIGRQLHLRPATACALTSLLRHAPRPCSREMMNDATADSPFFQRRSSGRAGDVHACWIREAFRDVGLAATVRSARSEGLWLTAADADATLRFLMSGLYRTQDIAA
jgi:DNA-binding response OmpR family regulator